MSQLDRLPENGLRRAIIEQQESAGELKAAQSLGSSSILTSRVFSSNVYDAVMNPAGSMRLMRVDVEFLPTDMTFGGAFCHRLEVKAMTSANVVIRTPLVIQRRRNVDNRQQWSVYLETYGNASELRRLKFYFFATGSGTFTATVVN